MSTHTVRPSAVPPPDVERPEPRQRQPRKGVGWIVAGSMAAGVVIAVALVVAPFVPARAEVLNGVVLLGFAVGWTLLAVLSVRFSDRPQRWAAAPAVFLAIAGLVSILGSETVVGRGFRWVWPPVLLAIVVWCII